MKCHHFSTIKTENGDLVPVPCGKCMPCRVNRSQEWTLRLEQEMVFAKSAHFLTLTYDQAQIPRNDSGNGILIKSDFQKFLKRLRYYVKQEEKHLIERTTPNITAKIPSVRYYLVGEYGEETFRPHGHAIIFNIPANVLRSIEQIWKQGHVRIGTVTHASISYVTKYITKVDTRDLDRLDLTTPFQLMSVGIGARYASEPENKEYHSRYASLYTINKKYNQRIGKYLEDKIHTTPEAKARVKSKKRRNSEKAQFAEDQKYAQLRKDGVDIAKYDREQREQQIRNLSSKKRNKL